MKFDCRIGLNFPEVRCYLADDRPKNNVSKLIIVSVMECSRIDLTQVDVRTRNGLSKTWIMGRGGVNRRNGEER